MAPKQRMRVANEKASKNITQRGNVPKSTVSRTIAFRLGKWSANELSERKIDLASKFISDIEKWGNNFCVLIQFSMFDKCLRVNFHLRWLVNVISESVRLCAYAVCVCIYSHMCDSMSAIVIACVSISNLFQFYVQKPIALRSVHLFSYLSKLFIWSKKNTFHRIPNFDQIDMAGCEV